MLANRRLARHIADAGFAEIRRQLAYKTGWNGGRLLVADRWYPSSKTCSANLAALAARIETAGSGPVAARGADRKTRHGGQVAVKREPGTTPVDQTGTVPPQGRTTNRVLPEAH
ncbi:hypothetical protein O7626_02420 [Micromonospora sp. WMMD1102]|uniref:zinc ribbon domain-containing protein n=1 Tax=Micromonospora sp. WMMD1102 TaxID=3016105 RepID=UPI00241510D0|nr:hypothetical protein [Micromonospora sp. WMMD1102]MDG4784797.1 hypothetical protein [Micromonospora sp. WMMD1102]